MILIVSNKDDFTADFVIDKLNKQKVSYYRLNCEDLPNLPYTFNSTKKTEILIDNIGSVSSVWLRRTRLPLIQDEKLSSSEMLNITYEYEALFNNFIQTISTSRWLSHPNAIRIAENKILQIQRAIKLGFSVPETLVSSERSELLAFANSFKDIIIKPLKSGRIRDRDHDRLIYTNKLDPSHLENLSQFDLTPCIFQRQIEKEYEIRVTVVGDQVFAARVDSQLHPETKIDWRKKKLKFKEYILPSGIMSKCINLVNDLNLYFGAIDLIKSTDGQYYFLEINPNGQWAWIEMDTQQPIADCIINFLRS